MENCLKQELKVSVNNHSLPYLGKIHFNSSSEVNVRVANPEGVEVDNIGSTTIKLILSGDEINILPNNSYSYTGPQTPTIQAPANSDFLLDKKYFITELAELSKCFTDFTDVYTYLEGLATVRLRSDGDFSVFRNCTLVQVDINSASVISHLYEGLQNSKESLLLLTKYATGSTERNVLTMAQLGEFKAITTCTIPSNQVSGTVEEFVAKQRNVGRTSGSVTFVYPMNLVTYNGQTLADWLTEHSKDRVVVSWDANNITLS